MMPSFCSAWDTGTIVSRSITWERAKRSTTSYNTQVGQCVHVFTLHKHFKVEMSFTFKLYCIVATAKKLQIKTRLHFTISRDLFLFSLPLLAWSDLWPLCFICRRGDLPGLGPLWETADYGISWHVLYCVGGDHAGQFRGLTPNE